MDPKEIFVVVGVTRGEIAEQLSEYLDDMGQPNRQPLTADDARLTAAVCREYATALPVLEEDLSSDDLEEQIAELQVATLQKLGMLPADWEPR